MSTSSVISSNLGTGQTLGMAGGYITATINPGIGNPLVITTVTVSSNITETLATNGLVSLEAGKTYKISAGIRLDPPSSGHTVWFIRTSTGTNISGQFSNDSNNNGSNISPLASTQVLYTPAVNEDIGMYLDAASNLGEVGTGSYLVVEEIPTTTFVSGSETTITNNNGTSGQVLTTNGDGTSSWVDDKIVPINTQTSIAYSLALSDSNGMVIMDNASPNSLVVPSNLNVAFPIGTNVTVTMGGTGVTTIAPDTGVTINSEGGLTNISGQYATVSLLKTAINTWLLYGSLA